MIESKSIFVSKTFWLNLALVLTALLQHFTGVEIAATEVELLVAGLLNIALRYVTVSPVKVLPPTR